MGRVTREQVAAAASLPESGVVTVACKLPCGLILQLCQMEEMREPIPGGGFKITTVARRIGDQVVLNPARVPFGVTPEYKIIGGYALTENVDAQFFAEWLRQNSDALIVKNKLIFAYEKDATVVAAAREHKSVQSGFEPINMNGDPRMPKDIRQADRTNADMAA